MHLQLFSNIEPAAGSPLPYLYTISQYQLHMKSSHLARDSANLYFWVISKTDADKNHWDQQIWN